MVGRGPAKSADAVKQAHSREGQDWTLREHRADRPSDDLTLEALRHNGVHKERGKASQGEEPLLGYPMSKTPLS
jgi:hypothetical protein